MLFYILEVNPFQIVSRWPLWAWGYSLFEQGVQLQLGRSRDIASSLLKDLKAVYEPSLDYIFRKIPIF